MRTGTPSSPPDELEAWSGDFSYGYLSRLYELLGAMLTPATLGEAAEGDVGRVFIRHDLDVSLTRAVKLARMERTWNVATTYHVMLSSPFYDVRSDASRAAIAELLGLGHEVGLHYDVLARGTATAPAAEREADIARACTELEELTGTPVRSLSFHMPVAELMHGPLRLAGRVSAYASQLFDWYISDSRGRWREGEPIASLARPRGVNLQILIHPVWWSEQHAAPGARLHEFLLEAAPTMGRGYDELNDVLWDHIIRRAERPE